MKTKYHILIPLFILVCISLLSSCGVKTGSGGSSKSAETTPTSYYMINYNWDNDEGQVPVKWGGEMFGDMPGHAHDLAQLSAALCASAGDSRDDGDKLQDYYITKAYEKLGMDTVLYNYPDSTEGFEHKLPGNKDVHCFAIGYKDVKIKGETIHVILVTMRGTQTNAEAVGDFLAKANVSFPNKQTKDAYTVYDYWSGYSNTVLQNLKLYVNDREELKTGRVKIIVGGHSLGGGAANLVGAKLDYNMEYERSTSDTVPKVPGDPGGEKNKNSSWAILGDLGWMGPKNKDDIMVFTFGGLNVFDKNIEDIAEDTRRDHPEGEMFDNIHNLFTFYDTFGPKGDGMGIGWMSLGPNYKEGFKPAHGEKTNLRKFGTTFTMRGSLDYKTVFDRGKKRYRNHNMPAYAKALYDSEDKLTGINEPISGETVTAIPVSMIPSVKTLNDFLKHFASFKSRNNDKKQEREYDCRKTTEAEASIMSNLFGEYPDRGPCVDYSLYPTKDRQPEMYFEGTDPKKWAKDKVYARFNRKQINWILMNIFNVPYQDERKMAKTGEKNKEFYSHESSYFNRNYYKPNGKIASDTAGVAQPGYHKVLIDDSGHYCIKYSYGDSDEIYYAVMELKRIDGKSYWSIYSNSKTPPENLKKYFEGSEEAKEIDPDEYSKYVEGGLSKNQIEHIFEEAFFYEGDTITNGEMEQRRLDFILALMLGDDDSLPERIPYDDYPEEAKEFSWGEALPIEEANRYLSFFSDYRYEPNMSRHEFGGENVEFTDGSNLYFDNGPWRSSASYDAKATITGVEVEGSKAYLFVNLKRYTIRDSDDGESYTEEETADLDLVGTMIKMPDGKYRLDHIDPEN